MIAFAELLERLVFTPGRLAKIALLRRYFATQPDPDRGFGLAALSLVTGGASRLFSPLTWQSGRGLQIESVWATPLMVARAFDPARWTVRYSTFQAYEVFGPGVSALLVVSTAATELATTGAREAMA